VLFEVETDKATMEVEAQGDGFLTDVTASEGTDVPVGNVIAKISDSVESTGSTTKPSAKEAAPSAPSDDLPAGKEIIMPTLGMAQDTGFLVTWHKAAGDAVSADDVLFEVETDKSTVEVNAGAEGYLAAILAEEGEEIPVGQTIAIISAEAPTNPITRKAAQAEVSAGVAAAVSAGAGEVKPAATTATAASKSEANAPASDTPVAARRPPVPATAGRILASPKLRRLAHEQGLDLARLVEAGFAQPFHVRDLEVLKALPTATSPGTAAAQTTCRLTADVPTEGFTAFAVWAAESAKLTDTAALLAGLCAASMGKETTVAVERFGESKTYAASGQLTATKPVDDAPQLYLRDLSFTAISTVQVGAEDVPTLTLTRAGSGLAITLEYAGDQLSAANAISLLSNFAGRIEQPLRHLF
jgi:pyruvate/2-oxoglutarate dehydrogenase complex dihydrolipoamide acyltransferase (E2) component